jgi:hypothetical protein
MKRQQLNLKKNLGRMRNNSTLQTCQDLSETSQTDSLKVQDLKHRYNLQDTFLSNFRQSIRLDKGNSQLQLRRICF